MGDGSSALVEEIEATIKAKYYFGSPVTKAKVTVTEKTPALDFRGKTYFFSGEAAIEKFKASPGKYLGELKDGKDKVKGLLKKKS